MVTKGMAVVLLLGLTVRFNHGIDRNTGNLPCQNMEGKDEFCGPLQFCSSSILAKGCRECAEVADSWCSGEERILEFKRKFPQCGILCDLKENIRLKEEINATGTALSKSNMEKTKLEETLQERTKERDKVKEENNALWNALAGVIIVAGVSLSTTIGMMVYNSKCKQRPTAQAADLAVCTASVDSDRPFWKRLCSCLPIFKKKSHPVQPEDPEAPSTRFLPEPTPVIIPASDSGRASGSSSSERLPSGGTQHQLTYTENFMMNSHVSATCGGSANSTTTTTAVTTAV